MASMTEPATLTYDTAVPQPDTLRRAVSFLVAVNGNTLICTVYRSQNPRQRISNIKPVCGAQRLYVTV